jgi:pyruvate, water dikinase
MVDRPTSPYTVWFEDYREEHRSLVGGKNASLGEMMGAGLPVPPGFALTTDAYETLRRPDLQAAVNGCLASADHHDPVAMQEASRTIRALIEGVTLPADIIGGIRDGYEWLCEHCETDDVPVAVRSSATAEDLPDASFAGQQDTYLWIRGVDEVVEHVKRCWSSMFTDRAIAYRRQTGYDHDVISMSVGIQKMVEPKAAGVAFTLNPTDGDRSQVAIDASWGLGEAVVSGEVTPDNYLVDKVLFEIVKRTVSPKAIEYCVNGQGVEVVEVHPDRQLAPCLNDDEIKAVARLARRAERHYGSPQDIEWAVDRVLPSGENVVLLQSRPETVWSRRPRPRIDPGGSTPMEGIVSTLLAPVRAKNKVMTGEVD